MKLKTAEVSDLPTTWKREKLKAVITPRREKKNPQSFGSSPFVGLEHVEAQTMRLLGTVPASTMKSSAAVFHNQDVIYSRLRPYLNKVSKPGFQGLCSSEFIVLPDQPHLRSSYLQYRLNASDFVRFASSLNAGDRPRVDFDQIGEFDIEVPPEPEQNRIVAKIEELFSDLDAGVAGLERTLAKLKRYRASVLKAAVEGRLTATWRAEQKAKGVAIEPAAQLLERILTERRRKWEAAQLKKFAEAGKQPPKGWQSKYPEPATPNITSLPALPSSWTWANVDQLSVVIRGASPRPAGDPKYFGGTLVPWITVGEITKDDSIYLSSTSDYVTEAGKEASRFIEPDTFLLTNSGATLGVPKITTIGGCINDGSVALLHLDYPLKLYLYFVLTEQTKRLRLINQGAAQPNLNTGIVKDIRIPLPPSNEQTEIVSQVESALTSITHAEAEIKTALARAARLRQAILKRAFEGRLV